jgi:L-threonylcarbamoyladenylate synthase
MLQIEPHSVTKIAELLKNDQVVALPTETVFGLAISLNSLPALSKLIEIKNRQINSGKVFTLVPTNPQDISTYANVPKPAAQLIERYFPGPLTLILPKNPDYTHPYFDNFPKIGVRIPDFSLFKRLLPLSGPLLLTSANPRGEEPCLDPKEVIIRLPDIDAVVMLPAANTPPSTILDFSADQPKIIRQGLLKID